MSFASSRTGILPVEATGIFLRLGNEEFAVCLVRIDDSRNRLEGVLVGAPHAILGVGQEFKTSGRNLISTVKALAHSEFLLSREESFYCIREDESSHMSQPIPSRESSRMLMMIINIIIAVPMRTS
jgi:hypothetical protein